MMVMMGHDGRDMALSIMACIQLKAAERSSASLAHLIVTSGPPRVGEMSQLEAATWRRLSFGLSSMPIDD